MTPQEKVMCDFLSFGFLPSVQKAEEELLRIVQLTSDPAVETFDPKDVKSMKDLLAKIVDEALGQSREVVVPVSAGLDSRGLLGAVLEVREAKDIHSCTWGHPGADDYDRSHNLVRKVVPTHFRVDLGASDGSAWAVETFVERAKARPYGVVLEVGETGGATDPRIRDLQGMPSLNGYLGDSLSGKKLNEPPDEDWSAAASFFVKKNRPYKGVTNVLHPEYQAKNSLPAEPLVPADKIAPNDQFDWGFRQRQRVGFFMGSWGVGSSNTLHPYVDDRWWASWVRSSNSFRQKQVLYRSFLRRSFPRVFPDLGKGLTTEFGHTQPTVKLFRKSRSKATIRSEAKTAHHVDMDHWLATNPDFKDFVVEALLGLKAREALPWLNLEEYISRVKTEPHGLGRQAYSLASLEINFQASKISEYFSESGIK